MFFSIKLTKVYLRTFVEGTFVPSYQNRDLFYDFRRRRSKFAFGEICVISKISDIFETVALIITKQAAADNIPR